MRLISPESAKSGQPAVRGPGHNKKGLNRQVQAHANQIPATCYSPTTDCRSTIAAEALHFRVRDGNGCYLLAMITGKKMVTCHWSLIRCFRQLTNDD